MATRTSKAGSVNGSDPAQSTDINAVGGGLIGYATATSNQTGITTAVDLTSLTLTLTPNASRIITIRFSLMVDITSTSGSSDAFAVSVLKDGTQIDVAQLSFGGFAANQGNTFTGFAIDIGPTNASHTYKLQGGRFAGTGTYATVASATSPAKLLIYDDGAQF